MTAVCHCKHCQKQSGTAFSIIVGVPENTLSINGSEHLKEFEDTADSGNKVHRKFCGNCGSPILSVLESIPGMVFVKAGTLDDSSWLEPTMHVWCASAQPWVNIPEGIAKFPKNPG